MLSSGIMVQEWWRDIWTSPMAAEYLETDKHGLYLLAELHHRRWNANGDKAVRELAAEIRHQEVRFGLTPIDRRRLQWEVEKGERAQERTQSRRQRKKATATDPLRDHPRFQALLERYER